MYSQEPKGLAPIGKAVEAIAAGRMAIVVDDPGRENEGDLVMAAQFATPEAINFMMTHGRGLICVPMPGERLQRLRIPPMVAAATDPRGTAFHVGVDLASARTGISAAERAATIRALSDRASGAAEFTQPGHVFPLRCRTGGIGERQGHTEASVELARLAGLEPVAVICEIAAADGEMMRLPELLAFGAQHGLPVVAISDLVTQLREPQRRVRRISSARIPLAQGEFEVVGFADLEDGREHLAIVHGDPFGDPQPLVRVHSECLTGDVLGSRRCDCGEQLQLALERIAGAGAGVVVYLRGHEGRGIGLLEKLRAYDLQERGLDTVDANLALGHPADARDYLAAAAILAELGVRRARLMTNNPTKRKGLERHGLQILDTVPLVAEPTPENVAYLEAKRTRMGHLIEPLPLDGSPIAIPR